MTDLFTKASQIDTITKVLIVFLVLFFMLIFSINNTPLQPEITKRPPEGVTGHQSAIPSPELSGIARTSVVKSSPEAGKEISSLQQHEMAQVKTEPAASTTDKTSQSTAAASDTSLRQNPKKQKNEKIAKVSQSHNTDSERPKLSSQEPVQSLAGELGSLPKETTTPRPVNDPQNLSRCLSGNTLCNRQLLTPEQLTQAEINETQRNLSRCLSGNTLCNRQLLTPEQLTQAEQRAQQRRR